MDGWMDGRMDGWMDEWMMDEPIDDLYILFFFNLAQILTEFTAYLNLD
jgi:hypothetical protein